LDTWFSSGLWPFSTMGWPAQTTDLAKYYPTTTLVTGFDIIFFWVARMTLMAGHFTEQMPFQTVYIHGLVLDEKGQKMSKSKNNGIDPILMINKYGADALRYGLITKIAGAGQNISFDYNRKTDESGSIEAARNFANKLWNASRFVMLNLEGQSPSQLGIPTDLELADRWILSRYRHVVEQVRQQIEQYGLGEAAKTLYEFIWGDFCDWYIELVKPRLRDTGSPSRHVAQQTLAWVLEGTLRLLHPLMPHITEELWQTLTQAPANGFLAVQPYPTGTALPPGDLGLEAQFSLIIETIRTIRNLRAEAEIKPGLKIPVILQTDSEQEYQTLLAGQTYLQEIAKVETLTITRALEGPPRQTIVGVVDTVQVLVPLSGVIDVAALEAKLLKDLGKADAEITSLSARLDKPGFVDKAKPEVVQGAQDALAAAQKQAEILRARLAQLE
jgi:valyl-tRNA synthetase